MLPLSDEGGRLHLAMANPSDERVLSEIRFISGLEVSAYVCVSRAVELAVRQAYDAREAGARVWRGAAAGAGLPPVLATVLPAAAGARGRGAHRGGRRGPGGARWRWPAPRRPADGEVHEVVLSVQATGKKRVLVVDDEPEIRLLVQRTLEKHGYDVVTAADGAEALRLCDELVPDLVLLDAMLPQVHGFEVCRRLKASPRTRQVPVIMMTAIYRGWRFAQEARDIFGAEDYVEKPFRLRGLPPAHRGGAAGGPEQKPQAGADRAAVHMRAGARARGGQPARRGAEGAGGGHPGRSLVGRGPRAPGPHPEGPRRRLRRHDELRAGRRAQARPPPAPQVAGGALPEKGFRRKASETLERAVAAAQDEASRMRAAPAHRRAHGLTAGARTGRSTRVAPRRPGGC